MTLVQISKGNTKTGRIPAVSLHPSGTCSKALPCWRDCYARKACRYSPEADKTWMRNYKLQAKPAGRIAYFEQISAYVAKHRPRFFRWHVAGDIPDKDYLRHMKAIAKRHPGTKFLAFTKRHDLALGVLPGNLSIVLSMWVGFGNPNKNRKQARCWVRDSKDLDHRIPADALECSGNCETCGLCWELRSIGRDVVINKH